MRGGSERARDLLPLHASSDGLLCFVVRRAFASRQWSGVQTRPPDVQPKHSGAELRGRREGVARSTERFSVNPTAETTQPRADSTSHWLVNNPARSALRRRGRFFVDRLASPRLGICRLLVRCRAVSVSGTACSPSGLLDLSEKLRSRLREQAARLCLVGEIEVRQLRTDYLALHCPSGECIPLCRTLCS